MTQQIVSHTPTSTQSEVALHVTSFDGNVYQYERVITTVYALSYAHLNALEAFLAGESMSAAMQAEFERVGVIQNGALTPLGCEVVTEAGLELPALEATNGVANLLAHVEVYEAPFAWDAEMAEVDTEELVAIDCLVEVKLPYQTAFLGRVVGVLHATREAQVWKLNSPKEHWYSMDYMRVIWTADVANEAYGWNEEALASTEVEVSA